MSNPIDLDYLASLARIHIEPEAKPKLLEQLGNIIEYLHTLDSVDVSQVEPMAHAFPLYNVWRQDVTEPCLTPEEALLNAPAKRHNQIIVPKVIDEA